MKSTGGGIKIIWLVITVIIILSTAIPNISENLFGPKICKIDGCPNEAIGGKYCSSHQCVNIDCHKERADGFYYCERCLEKGGI